MNWHRFACPWVARASYCVPKDDIAAVSGRLLTGSSSDGSNGATPDVRRSAVRAIRALDSVRASFAQQARIALSHGTREPRAIGGLPSDAEALSLSSRASGDRVAGWEAYAQALHASLAVLALEK